MSKSKNADLENYTEPLIKWVGGKTQIIDIIIKKFSNKTNNYYELFLGGGIFVEEQLVRIMVFFVYVGN